MHHLRLNGKLEIDFFKDSSFAELRMTINAEMKRLKASGESSKQKQAEPISVEEEEDRGKWVYSETTTHKLS